MKFSFFLTITALNLIPGASNYAQSWQWANSAGSISSDQGVEIVQDQNNYTYVAGTFDAPEAYFKTDTLISNGFNDIFLAKYSSSGTELWVR